MRLILAALLAVGLMGCQSGPVTPAQGALATCDQFAAALRDLSQPATFAKLSAGTTALVTKTRDAVQPFCTGPAPDVNGSVSSIAIDAGTKILNAVIASEVQ